MFCGNCGTENPEGTQFCAGCGADLAGEKPQEKSARKPGLPKLKVGKFHIDLNDRKVLIAGAVVLVLILVLIFGGNSPKRVVKKYMAAMENANGKSIYKLLPKQYINYLKDEQDMDKDDLKDMYTEWSEEIEESYENLKDEYDAKVKISYDIQDVVKIKGDDLEDIQDRYEDYYDMKVTAAKKVEVDYTLKCGDEYRQDFIQWITVIKVGGKWCIAPSMIGF